MELSSALLALGDRTRWEIDHKTQLKKNEKTEKKDAPGSCVSQTHILSLQSAATVKALWSPNKCLLDEERRGGGKG